MKQEIDPEELASLLGELAERLVVVEGRKDQKALNRLGITDIIAINGKPLVDAADTISDRAGDREVVLLTDFDREGRRIASRLRTLLQRLKVRVNSRLRRRAMGFNRTRIEDFGRVEMDRGDSDVKACTNFDKVPGKGQDYCKGCNREA